MPEVLIHSPADFSLYIPQILSENVSLLYLHGHLGAGKTTFVKELGKYLGIIKPIVSPTFTYIREYVTASGHTLHHLDLYRFSGNIDEILALSQIPAKDIVCIEWAELLPELAVHKHIDLTLRYHDETTRSLAW